MREVSAARRPPARRGVTGPGPALGGPGALRARWRAFERFLNGRGVRRIARLATLGLYAAVLVFGLWLGGHFTTRGAPLKALLDEAARLVGLAADEVTIAGLQKRTPEELLNLIGIARGDSLIGFDARRARMRLQAEDWIAQASVFRLFPNRLHIEIEERRPFALWQHGGRFYVIDRGGAAMTGLPAREFRHLPAVVGAGAETAALDLVNHLEAQPKIRSMVRAAVRVGERRWTLYLGNGLRVALPESGVAAALEAFAELVEGQAIAELDIALVDLRLADRIVIRLTDEAVKKLAPAVAKVGRG